MALGRKTGGRIKGQNKKDDLRLFAIQIEREVIAANGDDKAAMQRLICRLMTNNKQPAIAAMLATKWVDWRFDKPKPETAEINIKLELPDVQQRILQLLDERQRTRTIELAGDRTRVITEEQDSKLLSADRTAEA